jgi:RNA polymerase sigma-32 factor
MSELEPEQPDEIEEPDTIEVVSDDPPEARGGDALSTSSSTLSRRDPLGAYMRDVQRYPLLSKEEEHDLAVRYFEQEDLEAARRLVTSNLRLVVKIAYDYRQAYKNILDLVQEGNIGLMQAVKKYDPYKGVKLSSYAAWWIRAYILRYILNNHRLVKVGTTQAQRKLFFNLQKEKARLSAMGIEPTAELIAERLNVPERDVVSMDMRLAAGDASLDAPVGTSEGRSVARVELLPSDDVRIDDTLADAQVEDQFTAKIHEFGATLEGKEKKIFDDRLVADDPKTLQVLGDEFGVSRERVRQIEKRLLKKLKDFLHKELGDTVVDVYEST